MPEEYFDVAYINFNKAILHGRASFGRDKFGVRIEREIEQVLTDEQHDLLVELNTKYAQEMERLLSSFVERDTMPTPPEE